MNTNSGEQENESIVRVGWRIEKNSVPHEHGLSSLSKPRDDYGDLWDMLFYPTLTLMIYS